MASIGSQLWQIDLLDGWETEASEHCTTIYHPDGVGALQISAFRKRGKGNVSRDELLDATKLDEEMQGHLRDQEWGSFSGFQIVYAEDGTFWRKWWLAEQNVLVFVTYNCTHADMDAELAAVNQMLCSLRRA